jgi:hypothetical protein
MKKLIIFICNSSTKFLADKYTILINELKDLGDNYIIIDNSQSKYSRDILLKFLPDNKWSQHILINNNVLCDIKKTLFYISSKIKRINYDYIFFINGIEQNKTNIKDNITFISDYYYTTYHKFEYKNIFNHFFIIPNHEFRKLDVILKNNII